MLIVWGLTNVLNLFESICYSFDYFCDILCVLLSCRCPLNKISHLSSLINKCKPGTNIDEEVCVGWAVTKFKRFVKHLRIKIRLARWFESLYRGCDFPRKIEMFDSQSTNWFKITRRKEIIKHILCCRCYVGDRIGLFSSYRFFTLICTCRAKFNLLYVFSIHRSLQLPIYFIMRAKSQGMLNYLRKRWYWNISRLLRGCTYGYLVKSFVYALVALRLSRKTPCVWGSVCDIRLIHESYVTREWLLFL